jgi:S1-C subfamily serine protease
MHRGWTRSGRAGVVLAILAAALPGADRRRAPADRPVPADDYTFRPTVLVRRGTMQGSGTVIAAVAGETLILTAAHVVRGSGDVLVELHRYNFGLEGQDVPGSWPRVVRGEVAARDVDADVAVVRVRGLEAPPYVARLAVDEEAPGPGTVVTSLGIDRATRLSGWTTRVRGVTRLSRERGAAERPFLVTSRAPDYGRSGGGLFRDDGGLVGVCIGRVERPEGRALGLFAEAESISRLLRDSHLAAAVARSRPGDRGRWERSAARPRVTETRSPSAP